MEPLGPMSYRLCHMTDSWDMVAFEKLPKVTVEEDSKLLSNHLNGQNISKVFNIFI